MLSTAEQRAPGSSLRRAFSVMAVRDRLLRHLRQLLSVLVTWCQLWAFPLFQKGWKSSQADSRVFLRGLSVIQGRAAGRLSHTSAVTPHPKHINSLQRRKMEFSGSGFAKLVCVCAHREKSTHHCLPASQPLGKVSGRQMGPVRHRKKLQADVTGQHDWMA